MNGINFKNYAVMGTPTMFFLDSKWIIIQKPARVVDRVWKLEVKGFKMKNSLAIHNN